MSRALVVDTFASLSMVQPSPFWELPVGTVLDALGVAAIAASATVNAAYEWRRGLSDSVLEPSGRRLLEHALRALDPTRTGILISDYQAESASLILRDLIADAQPTPQVAVDEDGVIETIWLVNGTEVLFSIDGAGTGVLAAYAREDELFEYEFDELTDPLDRGQIGQARRLLNALGESVPHRVPV